jgi:hypothetical protein
VADQSAVHPACRDSYLKPIIAHRKRKKLNVYSLMVNN